MFSAARWRLTLVFTAILVVILAVSGIVVYVTTHSLIYDRVDAELANKASQDVRLVKEPHPNNGGNQQPGGGNGPGDEDGSEQYEFDAGGYFFAIVDPKGNIVDSSGDREGDELASTSTLTEALAEGNAITQITEDGTDYRIYVLAAKDNDNSDVLLQVGRSVAQEEDTLSQLQWILIAVVGIAALPAMWGGYTLSGFVLRPIQNAIHAQRAFIADASHELRTPVAVVKTNAELLEGHLKAGTIGQRESDAIALEDILSESDRLGKIVGQMLTLAQADAGQSIVTPADLPLDELATEVARSMRALAEAKQIMLTAETSEETWVHGDRERLREVMVTLIDNAIRYTEPSGRVTVGVAQDRKHARLTISDNGAGIPPDALAHIFERFYRVDKARSRDEGGTGLGLAIAHQVVEAHGGTIHIDSEPGTGTQVTIELRLVERPAAEPTTLRSEASTDATS